MKTQIHPHEDTDTHIDTYTCIEKYTKSYTDTCIPRHTYINTHKHLTNTYTCQHNIYIYAHKYRNTQRNIDAYTHIDIHMCVPIHL